MAVNVEELNSLSYRVIRGAMSVHRELGAGLEEPDYEPQFTTLDWLGRINAQKCRAQRRSL
jgi:hypothetical protein